MSKSIDDKINGIIKSHHESSHIRIGDGNRLTFHHLLYPKRNNRATTCHYIAITSTTDSSLGISSEGSSLSNCHFFHHSFRYPHRINGISSLICRKNNNIFYTICNSRKENIICSLNICTNSLHWKEFT